MADVLDANKDKSAEENSNVKVINVSESLINQESYRIRAGRGIALVINNVEFQPQLNLVNRSGSTQDAVSLYSIFQELGFESDLLNDATDEDIVGRFHEIKANKNKLQYTDCLVVTVLSHGEGECIFATNTKMKVKSIMDEFNAENCPELILKPKIFIFGASDACRRDQNGHGVIVNDFQDSDYYSYLFLRHKRLCIPNEADFLALYSTLPGHVSFRNTERGTTFIRILSEELLKMKKGEDIYKVLLRVNRKVGNYKPNMNEVNNTQVPYFVSHLTKELILKQ